MSQQHVIKVSLGQRAVLELTKETLLGLDDQQKASSYRRWTYTDVDFTVKVAPMTHAIGLVSVFWSGASLQVGGNAKVPRNNDHIQRHMPLSASSASVVQMKIPGPEIYESGPMTTGGSLLFEYDNPVQGEKLIPYANVIVECKVNGLKLEGSSAGARFNRTK